MESVLRGMLATAHRTRSSLVDEDADDGELTVLADVNSGSARIL